VNYIRENSTCKKYKVSNAEIKSNGKEEQTEIKRRGRRRGERKDKKCMY
jgi:hypothetical protein